MQPATLGAVFALALLAHAAATAAATASFGTAATKAWDEYVLNLQHKFAGAGIQAECEPRRFPATAPYQGAIIMFHGYTACPQQWYTMAPLLNALGYDVLAPLNPGHGLNFTVTPKGDVDNLSALPTTPQPYEDFVTEMNGIMELAGGQKVVAGLSLGGAIAVRAGVGLDAAGDAVFTRQLILNPFLGMSNGLEDDLVRALNALPFVRDQTVGFGAGCLHERANGRAGICTFYIKNMAAARDFGQDTLDSVKGAPEATQVVYDIGDPVVGVYEIKEVYSKYGAPAAGKSMCNLPHAVGHSFLSKWDTFSANKWWRDEAVCRLISYLTQTVQDVGDLTPLPDPEAGVVGYLSHHAPLADGFAACDLNCTATTCPYHFTRYSQLRCPFKAAALRQEATAQSQLRAAEARAAARVRAAAAVAPSEAQAAGQQILDWACFLQCSNGPDACGAKDANMLTCWEGCFKNQACWYSQ